MKSLGRLVCIALLVITVAVPWSAAPVDAQDALSAAQRNEIENLIRSYLLEHPELMLEVFEELEKRQQTAAEAQARTQMQANREALLASAYDHVVNPEGTIPVVEFFDYQCSFCKRIFPSIVRLQSEAKDVRLILKEFPILGEMSDYAARAALAARQQDKYMAFHNAMMELRGRLDEDRVLEVAAGVGLDVDRLRVDMAAPEIQQAIDTNRALAGALGIRGTPAMIIGDKLIPGAIDFARMTELVNEAKSNCQIC